MIGSPEGYSTNKQKEHFPPTYDTKIPNQSQSVDEDDIAAALDSMRISEIGNEEEKSGFQNGGKSDANMYMPVKALNQFSADWTIKVRVTKKGDERTWKNDRGQGKLFSVDMVDQEGTQIQGTFFNQQVEKFYPLIKENKVYTVSNGTIKLANKRFTSIPNDYQISFQDDTEFKEAKEDTSIRHEAYAFKNLKDLADMQTQSTVDVIGVVTETGPIG
jgi:replication factor A1